MYNVTKYFISNQCCSFEMSIHQIILKTRIRFHKKYEASQQSSTLIRIINVSYNNAENVALNYRNK